MPEWLKSLDHLTAEFSGYTVVSGRSGVVSFVVVRTQREMLGTLHDNLETLSKSASSPDAVEGLLHGLSGTFSAPAERQKQYSQRLAYGLRHYFTRHYRSTGASENEEE